MFYLNGWTKEKIVNFFSILDWLMQLPPEETQEFRNQLAQLEEEQKIRYVTSIERLGIQKGFEEATKQAALNLKHNLGFTAEKIAEALEVPLDKIKQILNQANHKK